MPPAAAHRHPGILRQLLLPLEPAAIVTMLALAGVLWACFKVLPAGIALMAILLSWFFKYSFTLLDQQASGRRGMPVLSLEMIMGTMGEFRWLVPLLLVLVAFFSTGAASFLLGRIVAALAAALLLGTLPAMLVIQGWTGRVAHSLDPRLWWRVALERIAARVDQSEDALAELRWLLERTSAWESPTLANLVATDLVSRLLRADREGEALRIVRQRMAADPGFRPLEAAERRRLGELAVQWRDVDTARQLQED